MKKTFGVCAGILAMGIAILLASVTCAQARSAAGEPGGNSESTPTATAPASSPATSRPADLRERIDALKAELAELNKELAAERDSRQVSADAAPQDQGSAAPANPPQGGAAAATPPAPAPLPNPSMAGPLSTAVPHEVAVTETGKIQVTGILSGMGWTEGDYTPGLDTPTHYDVSNAQVFIQKTTGWWQFYLQGGAYNLPAIGVPFLKTKDTINQFYGPFPQGYLKLVKGNFNVEVGALPTLIGAEYTFSFENMNIERGLLWNQENAVNRGIQLNDTWKKLTVAFSWNDGFYSNRYSWLSGSLSYAINASNTLTFVGMGNAGAYNKNTSATPRPLNNSQIYNLLYTYSHGSWVVNPYYQYTNVKTNTSIGIGEGAHTNGGAILVTYNFKHGVSLSARPEYIKSSGNPLDLAATNLLYGPGSGAFGFTVTPNYVKGAFFMRGDFSIVHATNFNSTTGFAFGPTGTNANQPRGVIETGFMF